MVPAITSTIPAQNFEIIRDQIGLILATELANQYALDNTYPNISKVWVERFIDFDSNTELPTINICLNNGTWDNKTQVKSDGLYIYNIDMCFAAPSSVENGPGDQYSIVKMSKIAGLVRAILFNPAYNMLALSPGIVKYTMVENFSIGYKSAVVDALSDVIGRIQFSVSAIETVSGQLATGTQLEWITTKTFLNESDQGFFYELFPLGQPIGTEDGDILSSEDNILVNTENPLP